MHLPQFGLLFDIGCANYHITEVPRLLLTHGHLDHSSGVAYYISQRNLRKLPPADIYVPPPLEEPLRKILQIWCEIEGYQSQYNLQSLNYDKYYHLQGTHYFKAIPSVHRVPSNGYTIFEKRKKIKEEFKSLAGAEIAKLKKIRSDLFFENYVPIISFSGDTKIEFILNNDTIRNSEVLFLECTYIDKARTTEQTRFWGHIHLDEIVANASAFDNIKHLFLIHFSPRYTNKAIRKVLKEKLPNSLYQKTTPFLHRRT